MKRYNYLMIVAIVIAGFTSCQKPLDGEHYGADKLPNVEENTSLSVCAIPVTGQITTNTTWTTGNVYLLQGIVEVNGAKLTIQPGVVVLGEKATKGGLVINRNAEIEAIGTECSPIIFTSDQAPGFRAPGDYFGVALMGNAPNNQSNSLAINIHGTTYTAGGTNVSSSVGTFKYVQIHYAGSGSTAGVEPRAESSLILGSLGNGSVIDHIQITNSARDGLGVWGGAPTLKYVFNYENSRTDYRMSYGTRANGQFLIGFKDKATAYTLQPPYGLQISNNLVSGDLSAGQTTYPTISQLSLLGGNYCDGDVNFQTGIMIERNGNARIYNSVISKFSQFGLFLDSDVVVAKTSNTVEQLKFSYNTILNIGGISTIGYGRQISGTWQSVGGCALFSSDDMLLWLTGGTGCREVGNEIQPIPFNLGYATSLCGDKCASAPSFNLGTSTDLQEANYDDLNMAIFTEAPYVGALQLQGDASWTGSCQWMSFCMQTQNFCI